MKTIIAMYFCCIDHRMKVRIHLKVRRAPRDKTGSSLIQKCEEYTELNWVFSWVKQLHHCYIWKHQLHHVYFQFLWMKHVETSLFYRWKTQTWQPNVSLGMLQFFNAVSFLVISCRAFKLAFAQICNKWSMICWSFSKSFSKSFSNASLFKQKICRTVHPPAALQRCQCSQHPGVPISSRQLCADRRQKQLRLRLHVGKDLRDTINRRLDPSSRFK